MTLETIYVRDPVPEHAILPILKRYASSSVRLAARRDGITIREITYNVPESNAGINRLFRSSVGYWQWMRDSDEPLLNVGDVILVCPAAELKGRARQQKFAHGVSHCLFEPIRAWSL